MANSFYMDASALAKRYIPEKGSTQVDVILDTVPADRIYQTPGTKRFVVALYAS